ncbi:hypothetical protein D3C84_904380 [compost metagenome]
MDLAIARPQFHLHARQFALGLDGFQQFCPLSGVNPQAQFQGGAADHIVQRPAEQASEILVGLADQPVLLAGQQNHVRAQVKQRGEAFFRAAQRLFPLALMGDLADHPDHAWATVLVGQYAAADLQPVQAAIGPDDAVVHGLFQWRPGHCRMKGA